MIHKKIYRKLVPSICAIERLNTTLEELRARNPKPGDNLGDLGQSIVGTGFIAQDGWVLTNRHVFDAIRADPSVQATGRPDNWWLEWVHLNENRAPSRVLKKIMLAAPLTATGPEQGFDVALLKYSPGGMGPCGPVQFGQLEDVWVGADIAICGYLQGEHLLAGHPGGARIGPVVHAGMISGVAPHWDASPRDLRGILTDLRTGGGFSGSPLFIPKSGQVIGLHHSGVKDTLGIGLPIDAKRVAGWVSWVEGLSRSGARVSTAAVIGGGDMDSIL